MNKRILFIDSPDSSESPCPHCIYLRESYEKIESKTSFEHIPRLVDSKQDSHLNKFAQKISRGVGMSGIGTPCILNQNKGVIASRGPAYFYGYLKGMLGKWLNIS